MKIKGKLTPIRNKILVSKMNFDMQQTPSGLFIPSDNGKSSGIHPRWAQVFAIGHEQKDVKVGDWVCVEHGRWSRTVELENSNGDIIEIRMIDNDAILMISEEEPQDVMRVSMGTFDMKVPNA